MKYENTLYLIRGISGSGKTTLAETLEQGLSNAQAIAADDFWYLNETSEYKFDISKLGAAHAWCKHQVERNMSGFTRNIIVHNTLTSEKELKPYIELAEKYHYNVVSLIVENRHGNKNVHDVPDNALVKQQNKLTQSIKLI